jgi:hypothetical protein
MDAFYINLKAKIESTLLELLKNNNIISFFNGIDYPKYKISTEIGIVTENNAIENLKKFLIYDFKIVKGEEYKFETQYPISGGSNPLTRKHNGFTIYIIYFGFDDNCYINLIPSDIRADYIRDGNWNWHKKVYLGFELYTKPFWSCSKYNHNDSRFYQSKTIHNGEYIYFQDRFEMMFTAGEYKYIPHPDLKFTEENFSLEKINHKIEFNTRNSSILYNEMQINKIESFCYGRTSGCYVELPVKINLNSIYEKIILEQEKKHREKKAKKELKQNALNQSDIKKDKIYGSSNSQNEKISKIKNTEEKECICCCEIIVEKLCLVPCGHANICKTCYERITNKKCPTCREDIMMQIKIFE